MYFTNAYFLFFGQNTYTGVKLLNIGVKLQKKFLRHTVFRAKTTLFLQLLSEALLIQ